MMYVCVLLLLCHTQMTSVDGYFGTNPLTFYDSTFLRHFIIV